MNYVDDDVAVDRNDEELGVAVDYFIAAYIAPDSGEDLHQTSRLATVGFISSESGWSKEFGSAIISVPLTGGEATDHHGLGWA